MKIDVEQVLTTISGEVLEIAEDTPITVKKTCVDVLLAITEADKGSNGEQKLRYYNLANKIQSGGEVDLTAEEVVLLKERIGTICPTLIVGKMFEILDPRE